MRIHPSDRLDGLLNRCRRWPLSPSLRRAIEAVLVSSGFSVCNPAASPAVLTLALLVASLPVADIEGAAQ